MMLILAKEAEDKEDDKSLKKVSVFRENWKCKKKLPVCCIETAIKRL